VLESGNSIHPGELDVHKNEARRFLDSELQSLLGCLTLYGLITLNVEHVAHELSIFLVVFDDEDQLAGHLCFQHHWFTGVFVFGFHAHFSFNLMDGQGEGKRTALTYLALHPNLSSSVR
jgi:hypothetical protein